MLEIRDLRHDYAGRTVLSVPSWDVADGEACLVLGPSGSGKSTLLAVAAGLLKPTAGRITLAGQDLATLGAAARDAFRARHVGLVMQSLHLIGVLSVRDNLRLAQRLATGAVDEACVSSALESLGIATLGERRARELSVGEAQRVAVARAVVNRPSIVLADEPTSALDDANCAKAIELLIGQARACGAALLVATHDHRIRGRFARELVL